MLCAAEQLAIIAKNPLNEKTRVTSVREYKFCPLIFYVFVQSGQNRHQTDVPQQFVAVPYPGILFGGGGGVQKIQLRKERTGIWGAVAPIVRDFGSCCNLVQEISFHIVKFS